MSKDACSHAELLPRMMDAVGLDVIATALDHPEVTRALRRGCTLCTRVEPCAKALDGGTAIAVYRDICPNAPLLEALLNYEQIAENAGT